MAHGPLTACPACDAPLGTTGLRCPACRQDLEPFADEVRRVTPALVTRVHGARRRLRWATVSTLLAYLVVLGLVAWRTL